MKKTFFSIFLVLHFTFFGFICLAQEIIHPFDTIQIEKAGKASGKYVISGELIKEISLQKLKPVINIRNRNTIGGNIGQGAITLFTGLRTGDTKDVDWLIPGKIETNERSYDWRSEFFCTGAQVKETQRVRNEDGSFSLETSKEKIFFWENGAFGFIIESVDTVGWFEVVLEPKKNADLDKWSRIVYNEEVSAENVFFIPGNDFALWGEFLGRETTIFYNSAQDKFYLFRENELVGTYKPDKTQLFVRKSKLVKPQLLINKALLQNERVDVLRLAMVAQMLKEIIEPTAE